MKIEKGEKWLIATRGADALEIDVLQDVLTHEDGFFKATIIKGERQKMSFGAPDTAGDQLQLRTTLTTWRKQLSAAATAAAAKTYRSSSGKEIPLNELPDTYLVNAIRKIEKTDHSKPGATRHPLYQDLLAELKKRPQQAQDFYIERRQAGK